MKSKHSKYPLSQKNLFTHFQSYAAFLLQNQYEDQFVQANIQLAHEKKLPLLDLLSHLPEEELIIFSREQLIVEFLKPAAEGTLLSQKESKKEGWLKDQVKNASRRMVSVRDISLGYHIRKSVLLDFLPLYTKDVDLYSKVCREIDEYFFLAQEEALESFEAAQISLREDTQKLLDAVMENLPAVICKIDKKGFYKEIRGSGLKSLGLKDNELVGKNLFDVHPNSINVDSVLKERKPKIFEGSLIYNGDLRIYDNYYYPDQDGGATGFSIEITERKKVQERLEKSEEKLRLVNIELEEIVNQRTQELLEKTHQLDIVINGIPALICYIDKDRRYRFINETYFKWFGPDAGKIVGKTLEEGLGEKGYQTLKPYVDKALSGQEVYYETQIPCKLGLRNIEGRYIPDIGPDGKVRGYIAMILDITDSVEIKQQLNKMNIELSEKNSQLLRINNDLDNFIYTASHDLKAPVSNIEGLVTCLKEYPAPDNEFSNLLEMMKKSLNRFRETVEDLTEIAKIQKSYEEDEQEEVDMECLLSEVESDLKAIIQRSKARITQSFSNSQFFQYTKRDLRSILYNLLSNALKYKSPDRIPEIAIESAEDNEFFILSVRDNGLGIPEDKIDSVFKMFKRAHNHVEGTGLGLYIIKRIIENRDGKIELNSIEGKGSEFKVYIRKSVDSE